MRNVDGITVHLNSELAEVLSILDKEVEKKIVLVVDEKQHLHGTITDGDVRRALLNGAATKSLASEVMFKDFKFVRSNTSNDELKRIFIENNVLQLPEIDDSGRLVGLHLFNELKQSKRKEIPVVIMAGGLGTRLRPLTDNCPKPMLEVGGKPILELIIDSLKKQGFYQFYIAVNYLSEQIFDYFGNGEKFSIQVEYIREEKRLGTAGALSLLPSTLADTAEKLIVLNGDVLTRVNFNSLLHFHDNTQSDATVCVRDYDVQIPFGVIDIEQNKVTQIVEKPIHKYFVNAGIYCINTKQLAKIPNDEYLDMPDLLSNLMLNDAGVNAFPVHEYWVDIGRHEQLEKAKEDFQVLHE